MQQTRTHLWVAAGIVAVALLVAWPSVAAAKGGWGWYVPDRDGYIRSGQMIHAQALIPRRKPFPRLAWLIPDWEWSNQPAKLPRERILVGELEVEDFRLRGDPMLVLRVTFPAPEDPGRYTLVTCADPCTHIAREPTPEFLLVVANRLEARIHDELIRRDNRIGRLEVRLHHMRSRNRSLEDRIGDQLRYLSGHATRIADLEEAIDEIPEPDEAPLTGTAALSMVAGAGVVFALGRVRRRRTRATP